jgi:hypothetical protein
MASLPLETVSQQGGNALLVILNPSPFVTLSEAKGLDYRLRINSVKNLKRINPLENRDSSAVASE